MSEPKEPFMALISTMTAEIRMTSELKSLDPQFHRRLLVRVLFSTFEGYTNHLRRRALEAGQALKYPFTQAEMEKLTEQKERRKDDGTVEMRKFFLKSRESLTFSIRICSQVMAVEEPAPPPSDDLSVAFALRDRLTHPKSASDFQISEAEGKAVVDLAKWFLEIAKWYGTTEVAYIQRVRSSTSESIQAQIREIRDEQSKLKGPAA